MKKSLLFLVLVLLSLTISCGGGGGSSGGGGGSSTANVSGTWNGTGIVQGQTHPTTLVLSQSGNSVSGTWDGYVVTGTVFGSQLTLTFTPWTQSGCYMTGSGSATVTGNSMSGTFSITASLGNTSTTVPATFTATRISSAVMAPAGGLVAAVVGAITK